MLLEIFGLLFGLVYVLGAILEKWWCWPAGIVSVILYGISMYFSDIYGESSLQIIYVFISLYGWLNWRVKKENIAISKSSNKELFLTLVSSALLSVGFYYSLVFLKGDLPFWDALTNGFAIGATWLVARKKIENWAIWIAVDLILTIILWHKQMYFYSVLYFVYTFMAIIGWQEWKKKL